MSVFDEEIRRRLKDVEDHFTERKEAPQEHPMREAITAFANTAIPEKPGIIYVGVRDRGEIVGGDNMDSWQQKISSWAASCFPPINVIPVALSIDGKNILAVVVPASPARPHFAKAAYIRKGARNEMASQQEIDEWIAYRNSKVRIILEWKGRDITIINIEPPDPPILDKRDRITSAMLGRGLGARYMYSVSDGQYRLVDCNNYWVTVKNLNTSSTETIPLTIIDLKMDDEKHQLTLLVIHYF